MPKLAVFPKAYLEPLCVNGSMSLRQWIELAATLEIDGLELYDGMLDLRDISRWTEHKSLMEEKGLSMPMLCCSPDFTHPDPSYRRRQMESEKRAIDLCAALGGKYCRVLSGQRWPDVSREQGLGFCVECIQECLGYARATGITLVIENHYKDNFWSYPEFAQKMDLFCELLDRIDAPNFGVNFDPSNTLLAGEDPLELLERVKHRVRTMHASDRHLKEGTLDDLRREELDVTGYARRLHHGEIGKGLNDYDAIFAALARAGFDGWISIEDGVDGFDQLERSVAFVRKKIDQYWAPTR